MFWILFCFLVCLSACFIVVIVIYLLFVVGCRKGVFCVFCYCFGGGFYH